ncbi:hypothetical protein [Reticulibacter mediterranei]|uniref:hypothetical protein n=1 Tax=Reticulibacter mediterranei TaxID=2778369 RepID=UPI001C68E091|nr:hypothetical protein [Reticulibacter mediterranei]
MLYTKTAHTVALQAQATQTVQTVLTAQVKATVTASPQYIFDHVTATTPAINNVSNEWNTGSRPDVDCIFTGGAYHIRVAPEKNWMFCMDAQNNYTDFIFQVQMSVIHGNGGGIIFRDDTAGNFYSFTLTNSSQYSLFALNESGKGAKPLAFGRASAGKTTSMLAVMAQGSKIAMFVDKHYIGSVDDTHSSTGTIGFTGNRFYGEDSIDVAFSNFQIWKL